MTTLIGLVTLLIVVAVGTGEVVPGTVPSVVPGTVRGTVPSVVPGTVRGVVPGTFAPTAADAFTVPLTPAVSTGGASVDATESLVTVACDTAVSGSLLAGTLLPDVLLPLALAHAANNDAEIAKHTSAVRRFPIRPTLLRVAVIALDECPPMRDSTDADMQRAGAPDGDTGSLLLHGWS